MGGVPCAATKTDVDASSVLSAEVDTLLETANGR